MRDDRSTGQRILDELRGVPTQAPPAERRLSVDTTSMESRDIVKYASESPPIPDVGGLRHGAIAAAVVSALKSPPDPLADFVELARATAEQVYLDRTSSRGSLAEALGEEVKE